MENKEILTIATDMGYMMLKYGGEIYRVEQIARYICRAYDVEQADVFAIPTSVVVTISNGDNFMTKTRRVLSSSVDLDKVDKLNALSRYICEKKPTYEQVKARFKEIEAGKVYPLKLHILAYALVSFGFSMVFGASLIEGISSFFVGIIVRIALFILDSKSSNVFLKNTFCSFLISALSFFSVSIGVGINAAHIMTGALMTLVPGMAITNCMRDFMANDYMAGMSKFTEAIMTALGIALGVSVVLFAVYGL